MQEYFRIGVITSPHGVRGEVRVFPTTDDPRRFDDLEEVILSGKGVRKTLRLEKVRYVKNMVILKLEGIDDRNTAETLRKYELMVDRDHAIALEEGEYYIADLIGMEVVEDTGRELGVLTDVLQTGANDVYVVDKGPFGEILIPNIDACIIKTDLQKGEMTVHLLPGLLPDS